MRMRSNKSDMYSKYFQICFLHFNATDIPKLILLPYCTERETGSER